MSVRSAKEESESPGCGPMEFPLRPFQMDEEAEPRPGAGTSAAWPTFKPEVMVKTELEGSDLGVRGVDDEDGDEDVEGDEDGKEDDDEEGDEDCSEIRDDDDDDDVDVVEVEIQDETDDDFTIHEDAPLSSPKRNKHKGNNTSRKRNRKPIVTAVPESPLPPNFDPLPFGPPPPPPSPPPGATWSCGNPACRDWKAKWKCRGKDGTLRCHACYEYFRRQGVDRAREDIYFRTAPILCRHCKVTRTPGGWHKGPGGIRLCQACYKYYKMNGRMPTTAIATTTTTTITTTTTTTTATTTMPSGMAMDPSSPSSAPLSKITTPPFMDVPSSPEESIGGGGSGGVTGRFGEWVGAPLGRFDGCVSYGAVVLADTGSTINVGDHVLLYEGCDTGLPFVARVVALYEAETGERMLHGQWYFRPGETSMGQVASTDPREIFYSETYDSNPIACILRHAYVLFHDDVINWIEFRAADDHFFYRRTYNPHTSTFLPLRERATPSKTSKNRFRRCSVIPVTPLPILPSSSAAFCSSSVVVSTPRPETRFSTPPPVLSTSVPSSSFSASSATHRTPRCVSSFDIDALVCFPDKDFTVTIPVRKPVHIHTPKWKQVSNTRSTARLNREPESSEEDITDQSIEARHTPYELAEKKRVETLLRAVERGQGRGLRKHRDNSDKIDADVPPTSQHRPKSSTREQTMLAAKG